MSVPAVLIRLSTGEIIKRGTLPGNPAEPIPGLDPDLKWLLVHQPFTEPAYDERYYVLQRIEAVTTDEHPTYPLYHQYRVTFATEKRSTEEILAAARNAEQDALQRVFKIEEQLKVLVLGEAVIFRQLNAQALNAKEQAIRTKVLNIATKVWQNDANREAKEAAITAGQEPNLDDGWQEP